MSVTHVAGPVVRIGQRILQRCVVCGEKLTDNHRTASPDGGPMPTWPERHLITHDGNRWTAGGDFADESVEVPADFCLQLVE